MEVLLNFHKFKVRVRMCYRTYRTSGYCGTRVQNSQKFRAGKKSAIPIPRVLWHGAYRAYRDSGYGYESLKELPNVPGIVARAYITCRSSGHE